MSAPNDCGPICRALGRHAGSCEYAEVPARAILVTNLAAVSWHETPAKASRQAHRWLRRRVAVAGEWATVLHPDTGAVRARYVRRVDGRITRMQ